MRHWNYRILRRLDGTLALYEVYYSEEGIPDTCSFEPTDFTGDNMEELKSSFDLAAKAFDNPILDYADFEDGGKYVRKELK